MFLQNFLKAFVAIDPISLIPILTIITRGLNTKRTIKLSGFVFLITCSVLIFFSLYGNSFLVFMGISISSFQIIGGFFLLIISYEMVFEKRVKRKTTIVNELIDENELNNLAVFPISIPLVAGPSAITLSVLISKDINFTMVSFYTQIFPLILTLFLTSIIIIFSNFFMKLFNKTIMNVLQKLFGLILGALAVEYVITGWNLTT